MIASAGNRSFGCPAASSACAGAWEGAMLKLVGNTDVTDRPGARDGASDGAMAAEECRVLRFPVGLAQSRGKREDELPMDEPALDAAWAVERAMLDVELNFMRLRRLMDDGGDRPRAA